MDQHVAPGLRLWMLCGLIASVLLFMTVIVCCFIRLRIPRTKRQIELMAARRKARRQKADSKLPQASPPDAGYDRGQAIVMNSRSTRPEDNRREALNSHSVNV